MRGILPLTIAAALAAAVPATARAQNTTPPPAPAPAQAPATTTTTTEGTGWLSNSPSHWDVAGFVGSNFGASANSSSVDFGGQVGYLYKGVVGGEFLADFAPSFNVNNAFLADRPYVNAYMVNAILAAPLGSDHQIQPYVSGGFGGVQLRSTMLAIASVPSSAQATANDTRAGGDVGVGIMGFAGNVGLRGDVRYYRAFTSSAASIGGNTSAADAFASNLLSGLDFWRANIGIAVRW
ncbi:MAG TPA: hypothetical protein VG871_22005 [Vicinamibacterales bacterium]|nr:hypothetical protein [Vicinamibacterales bacterium]